MAVIPQKGRFGTIEFDAKDPMRQRSCSRSMSTALGRALLPPPLGAQQAMTKDQLIGSWKVLSFKATTNGRITYPLGEHVAGYVTITPTRFWLLFVDATRKAPATPALTDAEAIAMMKTQVAWTGKYTTAEQTGEGIKLTARVDAASSQAIFDTDRVFLIRVDGNRMMVKSPGVIVPMTGTISVVEFDLVKAD
jgi:Lipocalin-like domain